jgi:hypothetical protein
MIINKNIDIAFRAHDVFLEYETVTLRVIIINNNVDI